MEQEEKIRLLLTMQEHPERFTDAELGQLLEDPELSALLQQLSLAKSALVWQDARHEDAGADTRWARLTRPRSHGRLRRVAAILAGLVVMAGLALAAMHWAGHLGRPVPPPVPSAKAVPETASVAKKATAAASDTLTVVFDNVTLEAMLRRMAKHYGVSVRFENKQAWSLRLYFEWNGGESLDETVRRLNLFESFSIKTDNHQIVVE